MDKNTLYIEDDTIYFNQYDKPLYHDCTMIDFYHTQYPYRGIEQNYCNASALYLISWRNVGKVYTHHVCDRHLTQLINQVIALQWAIVDERKGKA